MAGRVDIRAGFGRSIGAGIVLDDALQAGEVRVQRRVEELDTQTKSRQANELITGAGAVLGALFGAASVRGPTGAAGRRVVFEQAIGERAIDRLALPANEPPVRPAAC